MNLLLDTHAFVWWDSDKAQLSRSALQACQNPQNNLFLNLASVWEMQIKAQLGKLSLRLPLRDLVRDHRRRGLSIASLEVEDIFGLAALPMIHRDPFDRLLISQAKQGGYQLVRRDPLLGGYGVAILW